MVNLSKFVFSPLKEKHLRIWSQNPNKEESLAKRWKKKQRRKS
jgi:hypothetical protein